MISAPVVLQVLKAENAVAKNREIMGATNPSDAAAGTIRKDFAIDIEANSIHGSDSVDSAKREIAFFFKKEEILK
jgi:nucleoside-diphosphate kinase